LLRVSDLNVPFIITLSVIPDIDLLIPMVRHRGPTHSLLVELFLLLPLLLLLRRRALPYILALTQHSVIGDYIAGQTQLFWPITAASYGLGMDIEGQQNLAVEWIAFTASIILMLETKDFHTLQQQHTLNLTLSIPTFTVMLPATLSIPLHVPLSLMPPHLFFSSLFLLSIIRSLQTAK